MAVLSQKTDILVTSDKEKQRILSILQGKYQLDDTMRDRIKKAMQVSVEESFLSDR